MRPSRSLGEGWRVVALLNGGLVCAGLVSLGCAEDEDRTDVVYRRPDPAVAILPFDSSDPDLALEGVDLAALVALDLDAIGGLRAADPLHVRHRLESAPAGSRAPPTDPRTARRVGSETRARWAVLGTLRRDGGGVRIDLRVLEVDGPGAGDPVEIALPSGDPAGAADRLTTAILARLPVGVEARPRGIGRVATASPAALAAFLDGERILYEGRLDDAFAAYDRAVAADSSFALAHLRLAELAAWVDPGGDALEPARRAVRWSGRLAPREAGLARARLDLARARPEGLKPLRQVARRWPDDPDAWLLLGEALFRLGPQATSDPAEVDAALARATDRAPWLAAAWVHRVDAALADGDSARAAARLERLRALAPAAWFTRDRELRVALAFGDPESAAAARETLAASGGLLPAALEALRHPGRMERQREALAAALDDAPGPGASALAWNRARAGRFDASLRVLDDPRLGPTDRLAALYALRSRGVPVPDLRIESAFDAALAEPVAESAPETFVANRFFVAAWAVERGRADVRRDCLARLRRAARHAFDDADSLSARLAVASSRGIEGLVRWKEEGDRREAVRSLEGALHDTEGTGRPALVNAQIRWWLAEIHRESGDPRQAITFYGSFWDDPFAAVHRGALRVGLGDTAAARSDYAAALAAWSDPDPSWAPRVREIRASLDALPTLAATP